MSEDEITNGRADGAPAQPASGPDFWLGAWPIILLILSFGYLVAEFAFNTVLLDTASDIEADGHQIERVEFYGRALSGTGFALLMVGLSYRRVRRFSLLAVIAGASWATAFYGQKALIDHLFIDNSTWEERLLAQQMSLLKVGLAENLVEIEGLPFDAESGGSPQERTFLALMGGMVSSSPDFLQHARDRQPEIVRAIADRTGHDKLAEAYPRYLAAGKQFEADYQAYAEASKRYDSAVRGASREAADRWAKTYADIEAGWKEYLAGEAKFRDRLAPQAQSVASNLNRYFNSRSRCTSVRCAKSWDQRYERAMVKQFGERGRGVDPMYWCEQLGYSTGLGDLIEGAGKALGDVLSLIPRTEFVDVAKYKRCSVRDRQLLVSRMAQLSSDKFERQSGGYPYGMKNQLAFIDHPVTAKRIRDKLAKEGIRLPAGWTAKDGASFKAAVAGHIRAEAKRRWERDISAQLGGVVPPKLSYTRFIAHPVVQQKIRNRLGSLYVNGFSFEMSEAQFKRKVIDPETERYVNDYVRRMTEEAKAFANGGAREDEGKAFMRAVVVPPIALFFSLFFGLLTLGKSGYGVMALVLDSRPIAARLPRVVSLGLKGAAITAVAGLLLVTPFIVTNKFSASPAVAYFMAEAEKTVSLPERLFAEYVIRMQPVVYPAGQQLIAWGKSALADMRNRKPM